METHSPRSVLIMVLAIVSFYSLRSAGGYQRVRHRSRLRAEDSEMVSDPGFDRINDE